MTIPHLIHNMSPATGNVWSADRGYHRVVANDRRVQPRQKFYGDCRMCRHFNTCNLSDFPEGGCVNFVAMYLPNSKDKQADA